MAILQSPLELTGSVGTLSFYRRKDLDKIIVRQKAGPTKKQVQELPSMQVTRLRNAEFGGRAKAASQILRSLGPLRTIADYPVNAALHKILWNIQQMDTDNPLGSRCICPGKAPYLLEG